MGIIISHYKDPCKPTSIMESKRVFFVAQLSLLAALVLHLVQDLGLIQSMTVYIIVCKYVYTYVYVYIYIYINTVVI